MRLKVYILNSIESSISCNDKNKQPALSGGISVESHHPLTPDQALALLAEGNRRFVGDAAEHPHRGGERRLEVTGGQQPFAVVLTCSDSRVPPEIIFDRGIGDLFVIRVAGNIADDTIMGSISYAAVHLDCPLIVVLGHESCGAVTASLGSDDDLLHEPPPIIKLVEHIRRNIPDALSKSGDKHKRLDAAIRENADAVIRKISEESAIAERIASNALRVVHAYYSLTTGHVTWS